MVWICYVWIVPSGFFPIKVFYFLFVFLLHNKDDQFPWCYFFLFRSFLKLKYVISCMSTHFELLEWCVCCWNDEMWLMMHLWADKLPYIIPWVFPASRKDDRLAKIYFVHLFSLRCLYVAVPCSVNREITS